MTLFYLSTCIKGAPIYYAKLLKKMLRHPADVYFSRLLSKIYWCHIFLRSSTLRLQISRLLFFYINTY